MVQVQALLDLCRQAIKHSDGNLFAGIVIVTCDCTCTAKLGIE